MFSLQSIDDGKKLNGSPSRGFVNRKGRIHCVQLMFYGSNAHASQFEHFKFISDEESGKKSTGEWAKCHFEHSFDSFLVSLLLFFIFSNVLSPKTDEMLPKYIIWIQKMRFSGECFKIHISPNVWMRMPFNCMLFINTERSDRRPQETFRVSSVCITHV